MVNIPLEWSIIWSYSSFLLFFDVFQGRNNDPNIRDACNVDRWNTIQWTTNSTHTVNPE